jgi:hypothetical protein
MRALRALAEAELPLTEYDVYLKARDGDGFPKRWHDALATLVARGLAERAGAEREYRWFITAQGRAANSEAQTNRKR